MTILPLIIAPDPLLNQPSAVVDAIDSEVRMLLDDMLETMYASNGIGLAAVQVGFLYRAVVVDVEWREDDSKSRKPLKMINPKIVQTSPTESTYQEGCLSFPGQYSDVIRPEIITVHHLDEQGIAQTFQAEGLLATCIQHEIDHTDGINFVDHISRLKRDRILKKLEKAKKNGTFDNHDSCGDPDCAHEHE